MTVSDLIKVLSELPADIIVNIATVGKIRLAVWRIEDGSEFDAIIEDELVAELDAILSNDCEEDE